MRIRPQILTIAGFDPSGGAGILADVKTFESIRCVGMAVQTANTVQTADDFKSVNPIENKLILSQLDVLLDAYVFDAIKIGLVPSFELLDQLLNRLHDRNDKMPIIWDPVLSSSSGFEFHNDVSQLIPLLKKVSYITPNWNEIKVLSGGQEPVQGAKALSEHTAVYLKGGHSSEKGKDYFFRNGKVKALNPRNGEFFEKHGSGCVFASALTAFLAKGYPEQKAMLRAKRYIEHYLQSNKSLLGYHKL